MGRGARIIAGLFTLSTAGGSAMTIDIEPLKKQLGRKIEDEDVVTQAPLKAMIATFDRPEKAPEEGQPIAPGWHLCFLHSYARPAQLGRTARPSPAACCPRSRCRAACMPAPPSPSTATSGSATSSSARSSSPTSSCAGQHRHAGRHHPDAPHLHAARAGAHRGGEHGVPRGSQARREERRAGARRGAGRRAVAAHHHARAR